MTKNKDQINHKYKAQKHHIAISNFRFWVLLFIWFLFFVIWFLFPVLVSEIKFNTF
jgi:hypothetical protein